MSFNIFLTSKTSRSLEKLPEEIKTEVTGKIEELSLNPLPRGVAKLRGLKDAYRIRVGKYRILYRILWVSRTIIVFRISLREEAYRGF